jgi:hypothetical protein
LKALRKVALSGDGVDWLVVFPFLFDVFVKTNLELVALNSVIFKFEGAWIFDVNTIPLVVFNRVVEDWGDGFAHRVDSASVVLDYLVMLNFAVWVQENDSILVSLDQVAIDQKIGFTLHYEDAFLFSFFDMVVLDIGLSAVLTSKSYVSLAVFEYMIANDLTCTSFFNKDTLAMV